MTPRTQKAVDIFLDALNEGTLASGTCSACACGNLVAKEMGIKPLVPITLQEYHFAVIPNSDWLAVVNEFADETAEKKGKEQIASTGFTVEEFREIERAFENNTMLSFYDYPKNSKEDIRKDQLRGLTAVVDLLLSWDEDTQTTTEEVFTSKAEAIPL